MYSVTNIDNVEHGSLHRLAGRRQTFLRAIHRFFGDGEELAAADRLAARQVAQRCAARVRQLLGYSALEYVFNLRQILRLFCILFEIFYQKFKLIKCF